jgi:AraC-like DNA-binding protein
VHTQTQAITTRASYTIKSYLVRTDTLGMVLSGEKRLLTPKGEQQYGAGELFVMHRAMQLDVVNQPEGGGYYQAQLIQFSAELIDTFHDLYPHHAALTWLGDPIKLRPNADLLDAFKRAAIALNDATASESIKRHRSLEVLLLLAESGVYFTSSQALTWCDKVYRLVQNAPHNKWDLQTVSQQLLLTKSTLQRRLANENTSLSECLIQVRLDTGLELLQNSHDSVAQIAARCGYESHSRFGAAFKRRFGLSPSQLRQSD